MHIFFQNLDADTTEEKAGQLFIIWVLRRSCLLVDFKKKFKIQYILHQCKTIRNHGKENPQTIKE